jgi:hypothetical protein
MPAELVPAFSPRAIRRAAGSNVTFINNSATPVIFDTDVSRLAVTRPGVTPNGTPIAAAGGQVQFSGYPGIIWVRAIIDTTLDVQP